MKFYRVSAPSLVFALSLGFSVASLAAPVCKVVFKTNSEKYVDLEFDSPERLKFIRENNREVFENLKDSDLQKISDKIYDGYLKDNIVKDKTSLDVKDGREIKSASLNNGSKLILRDKGIGQETELVIKNGINEIVIATNFAEKRNNTIRLTNFSVSPNQKFIALFYYEKGSIDNFYFDVYSFEGLRAHANPLEARTIHRLPVRGNTTAKIAWINEHTFRYQVRSDQERALATMDAATGSKVSTPGERYIWDSYKDYSIVTDSKFFYLFDGHDGKTILPLRNEFKDLIGEFDGRLLFRTEATDGTGVLETFNPKTNVVSQLYANSGRVITVAGKIGDHVWFSHMRGEDRRFVVLNEKGEIVGDLEIPVGTNIIGRAWEKEGKVLKLTFTSKIKKSVEYSWRLGKDPDLKELVKELHTDKGVKYITHIQQVKSADGTLIPVKLTHRKDIKLNGDNPSIISVYGGFNSPGHMHTNSFTRMEKAFLERGGIIVGPAVRGGNEFGTDWYNQAKGPDKKVKTLEDTIATAEWLTEMGYSNPEKIAAQGSSNGGFVVAAAALKAPNVFGLVIPKVGVHDMLGKERLDIRASFKQDYGDANDAQTAEYMMDFSPLELKSKKNSTEFFVFVGANDSRVNPVHSYKLTAMLKDQGMKAEMLTLKNTGHFSESIENVNTIGWRAQSYVWAKLFKFFGLKY